MGIDHASCRDAKIFPHFDDGTKEVCDDTFGRPLRYACADVDTPFAARMRHACAPIEDDRTRCCVSLYARSAPPEVAEPAPPVCELTDFTADQCQRELADPAWAARHPACIEPLRQFCLATARRRFEQVD
jgi:hypothetical protein